MRARTALIAASLALLLADSVAADPTPVASPGPAECRIAPRLVTADDWLRVVRTEVPPSLFPSMIAAVPPPPVLPPGEPADAATRAGVERTLRELGACINAGDDARVVALYSDAYWARILPQAAARSGSTAEAIVPAYAEATGAAPGPPATGGDVVVAVEVGETRVMADGRAAAVAAIRYAADVDYAGVFVFVWSGGRWLVDDRQRVEQEGESTPAAVPSAS